MSNPGLVRKIASAADPTSRGEISSLSDILPSGTILDTAATTAPSGWLFCHGQAISRTTYSSLFLAIGTTYGVGNGSTTFNLPDTRGRTRASKDDMGGSPALRLTPGGSGIAGTTLGATGGAETHTLTVAQLAVHTHSDAGHSHGSIPAISGSVNGGATPNRLVDGYTSSETGYANIQNAGSGGAHQNTQPTIVFNTIIKY
jgi:microcystin-dependent protein